MRMFLVDVFSDDQSLDGMFAVVRASDIEAIDVYNWRSTWIEKGPGGSFMFESLRLSNEWCLFHKREGRLPECTERDLDEARFVEVYDEEEPWLPKPEECERTSSDSIVLTKTGISWSSVLKDSGSEVHSVAEIPYEVFERKARRDDRSRIRSNRPRREDPVDPAPASQEFSVSLGIARRES